MNAEALTGAVLGTCRLQKFLGQGSMGAVYQAQQLHPARQVAVKVLLSSLSQKSGQRILFLERFRREIDATTPLKHPHIVPIYEHGNRDGVAYFVMSYINGHSLATLLEQGKPLPFATVVDYLDQLASALDYAHEQGVIHGNIKPSNIVCTTEGKALLSEFGLIKVVTEGMTPQMRLTGPGTIYITPEYMAPELVLSEANTTQADMYALGVVVYQMITGKMPFQGENPMQVAAQHVQVPPPSPRTWRSDLPETAEHVLLRALSKRPDARYARAQDFASALRTAFTNAGLLSNASHSTFSASSTASKLLPTSKPAASGISTHDQLFSSTWQTSKGKSSQSPVTDVYTQLPAASTAPSVSSSRSRLGHKPSLLRPVDEDNTSSPVATATASASIDRTSHTTRSTGVQPAVMAAFPSPSVTKVLPPLPESDPGTAGTTGRLPETTRALFDPNAPLQGSTATGALKASQDEVGNTASMKLTGAVKVVQVPVAGQPGRYVTGLLPLSPSPLEEELAPTKLVSRKRLLSIGIIALALLVILGSISFGVIRSHSTNTVVKTNSGTALTKVDLTATANARAMANISFKDMLDQNNHNWHVAKTGTILYMFKNGAYHIVNNDPHNSAPALLPDLSFATPFSYSLTMQEIRGNDSSLVNTFGMMLNFHKSAKGVVTFYAFEIQNKNGGQYQFLKYDSSSTNGADGSHWKTLWRHNFGKEFHGLRGSNTITVTLHAKTISFGVNNTSIDKMQDNSLTSGQIGMLVNLQGTEVAFSNMLVVSIP